MADFLDTSSRIWILDTGGRVCIFLDTSGQFFILDTRGRFWVLDIMGQFWIFFIYIFLAENECIFHEHECNAVTRLQITISARAAKFCLF